MIVEADLINAAGGQEKLLEIFNLPDVTDPLLSAEYAAAVDFALDEAHGILTEQLGVTFSDVSMDSIDRADKLPLVVLGARWAVIQAKIRGRGRTEDVEAEERAQILSRFESMKRGGLWPGRIRPKAQKNRRQGFVPRKNLSARGFYGR